MGNRSEQEYIENQHFKSMFTNFNSLIVSEYKTDLVTTLLERCFRIARLKTKNHHD